MSDQSHGLCKQTLLNGLRNVPAKALLFPMKNGMLLHGLERS